MDQTREGILLVEDNPDHAELILRSFEDQADAPAIHHVADGQAALDYLFHEGAYADNGSSPPPRLVLLDLRLPKVDGLDVLKEIKASPELRRIPVVVLSTSDAERDIVAAYDRHANSYLVKPVEFSAFSSLLHDIEEYWLAWNRIALT